MDWKECSAKFKSVVQENATIDNFEVINLLTGLNFEYTNLDSSLKRTNVKQQTQTCSILETLKKVASIYFSNLEKDPNWQANLLLTQHNKK